MKINVYVYNSVGIRYLNKKCYKYMNLPYIFEIIKKCKKAGAGGRKGMGRNRNIIPKGIFLRVLSDG